MNDKQKARWDEVRDEMSKIELGINDVCSIKEGHTHFLPQGIEKILNRKDSKGNYLIEVPDVDQKINEVVDGGYLPPAHHEEDERDDARDWWDWAQQNMLKDKWKKFIPRE